MQVIGYFIYLKWLFLFEIDFLHFESHVLKYLSYFYTEIALNKNFAIALWTSGSKFVFKYFRQLFQLIVSTLKFSNKSCRFDLFIVEFDEQ